MARTLTEAERMRAHREEFLLAQELGVTPREARAELERRAARDRWAETAARLHAKMHAAPSGPAISGAAAEPREPWWMRD